jgi:ketosteroid isomerase-like protein
MDEAERLCRTAYSRYSEGDFDGMLELFDREVEVYVAPPNFESGKYKGHDEYRRLIGRWGAAWDEMRVEPRDMEVEGDWVLAFVEYIGRGTGSGVEITQPSWELSLWRDGLCRRYFVYWDEEEGHRAFEDCARRGKLHR